MSHVIVLGGGLAGLATSLALGSAGFQVDLFEARPFLGGRATSYRVTSSSETPDTIDNCQHVLLRCCLNLLDFYERLGVIGSIKFYREFFFMEPGGRTSVLSAGPLPAPFHFTGSFWRLRFLNLKDKIGIGRALLAIRRERSRRTDLDRITMLDWLREKRQSQRAIDRFWNPVLVSAINEELGCMAAVHGFQVFWLGFLAKADWYEMGVPVIPLGALYDSQVWSRMSNVRLHLRTPVERVVTDNGTVRGVIVEGQLQTADYYISSLPFERISSVIPNLNVDVSEFQHSPITGVHLWFDRPVMQLPHATVLDRTIQWVFNKSEGRYIQVVISASRSLSNMPKNEVIALVLRELAEFFPAVSGATLDKSHVIKEIRATFSAKPGLEALRPVAKTSFPNLFLAGDWVRSGWPATMEGAVRSGYLAAEAVTQAAGQGQRFLIEDVA